MFATPAAPPAAPALEVSSASGCPRAEEVTEALGRIGPASAGAAPDVADLREENGSFVITLRRASGEVLGEKRVPASLACSVRAEVAAVSIAALQARLGGDDAAPLPIQPAAEVSPPAAPVQAAPPAATVARSAPPPAVSLRTYNKICGCNATGCGPSAQSGSRFDITFFADHAVGSMDTYHLILMPSAP